MTRASRTPITPYRHAGIATLVTFAITAAHHIDGAILYGTAWRLHVAVIAPVLALIIVRSLYLAGSQRRTRRGQVWARVAVALILIFPVGLIGIVEGGYNHVAKNLLYFGIGEPVAMRLFPPPLYEMPDNAPFEISGIAQFPVGLIAACFAWRLWRSVARKGRESIGEGAPSGNSPDP